MPPVSQGPAEPSTGVPTRPLADRLDGLLFFPVTPCDEHERLNLEVFGEHVRRGVDAGAAAVFACCGTGEFYALAPEEHAACVAAAVEASAGRVPVVAGIGYGTVLASRYAAAAADAGADGLLAMPPYLVRADQNGLRRHYETLAGATPLPLILYQRDNAILSPATVAALATHPGVIGLKDGHGDLDLLQRIISAVRSAPARTTSGSAADLLFLNGMPTAEMTALAYRGLGVEVYSSAVFGFAPPIALAFAAALRGRDDTTVHRLLDGFYRPFVELRRQGAGYAVSLVKAGVRLAGLDVGPVRSPLSEPAAEHVKQLAVLVEQGLALVEES